MSVYNVPPVEVEPVIRLAQWRVYEVDSAKNNWEKTHHFVGYNVDATEGRVSNVITGFDAATGRGTTARGRSYHLVSDAGDYLDPDAEYVWSAFRRVNDIKDFRDVTEQYRKQE